MNTINTWTPQSEGAPHRLHQQKPLSSWYTQGLSDEIGDRLLMFDNTGGPSLELLRLRPQLVGCPGVEKALRERVELLAQFRHPAFTRARAVENLGDGNELTLISTYVSGKRLSDALATLQGSAFAVWAIMQLTPAIATLQHAGRGIAHGALTPSRITLTSEGNLLIAEHVLGPAIERLQASPLQLWTRFGIAANPAHDGVARLDAQGDVFQIALVALALLLGRPIARDEYPHGLRQLLDDVNRSADKPLPDSIRRWLARALQLSGRPFESAADAQKALSEFILESGHRGARMFDEARVRPMAPLGPAPIETELLTSFAAESLEIAPEPPPRVVPPRRWTTTSLGLLVAMQAVVIGCLLYFRTSAPLQLAAPVVSASTLSAPASAKGIATGPPPAPAGYQTRAEPVATPLATVASAPPAVEPAEPAVSRATARIGGIRVISPIELVVLDGDRVLGSSTDGSIFADPGRRELELVNTSLGYRARQVVDIKAGQILPLNVAPAKGLININALPWAEVSIDGSSVGITPLGDLSVPIGKHEIVFRHPTLGERRQTAIVRSDVAARVSADLR